MSDIDAIGFMAGYMSKEAEATALTPEQMKTLGTEGVSNYNQAMKDSTVQNVMNNQNFKDYGTAGAGAAIGGALGALGGGDIGSTLMGTALGGVVGWLAKHFFGGDIQTALQKFQDWHAKGIQDDMIKRMADTNEASKTDMPTNVNAAGEEVDAKASRDKLRTLNADTPESTAEMEQHMKKVKKQFAGQGGPFPQEAPQTQPVGTDTVLRPEAPPQPVPPLGPVTGQAPAPAEPYQQPDFSGANGLPTSQDPAIAPGKQAVNK
jgi:outer membrane lipoprotein SlyB